MIVKYFEDTDTLYLQFNQKEVEETRDLDRDTIIDYDREGHVVAITVEHAKAVANVTDFSFQHILPKAG